MTQLADPELRAKYDADELKALGAKGHAFKNPDGSFSYPIDDAEDLDNAIAAVGRGGADHDDIRKYIAGRAATMGLEAKVPDTWQADGSLKQANSVLGRRTRKRRHRAGLQVGREYRQYAVDGIEVRSAADGSDNIQITGTPIVYNTPYAVRDMFGEFQETMLPGVATGVLARGADVRFLFNHEGMPLARTTSGTLALADTRGGLTFTATLDARQQLANDLAIAVERGDVNQMSCGFVVAQDVWADDETRSIVAFDDLFDVSGVTYPASPTTSLELAQRALFAMPVNSQARMRRVYVALGQQTRKGAKMSADSASGVQSALSALHDALNSAGASLDFGTDDDETDDDGTEGGATAPASAQDGTGSRTITLPQGELRIDAAPATPDERRAAAGSFNDTLDALSTAIQQTYAGDDGDEWADLWVRDAGPDWVVWCAYGDSKPGPGLWRASYTLDQDGVVTLAGDPVQVTVETSYVPAERSTSPAGETRSRIALELELEALTLRGRRHR